MVRSEYRFTTAICMNMTEVSGNERMMKSDMLGICYVDLAWLTTPL